MRAKTCILFICLLAMFAGTAMAQTPDGETPNDEQICDTAIVNGDTLSGAAWGLCNAYCEAMDCELGDAANASARACERVAGNYERVTGVATLPCDCPCFADWPLGTEFEGTWNAVVSGPPDSCSNDLVYARKSVLGTLTWATVDVNATTCTWGTGNDGGTVGNTLVITAEEALGCRAALEAACPTP